MNKDDYQRLLGELKKAMAAVQPEDVVTKAAGATIVIERQFSGGRSMANGSPSSERSLSGETK